MSLEQGRIEQQELRYFGKVTASISHELKNVLAILNEQAGLLHDYVAMAEQGKPLDVQRIGRLSATMLGQIGRGDTVIRRMNRFAHSVDQDCASVDLDGLVTMVVELFGRTAAMRGVTIDVQSTGGTLSITTHPFALETLLGSLLEHLTAALPGIGALSIVLRADAERRISIPALAEHAQALAQVFESDQFKTLLADLQASAGFSQERGELFITLPETLNA